jgi:hypothetical protein
MSNIYNNVDTSKIQDIKTLVERNCDTINSLVMDIIRPYCKDLDKYVQFIAECLKDGNNPPTNAELEDFCLNLSTYIYFAGGMCEQLGIRDDISKAVYKECYNTARASQDKGTVADKDSMAELHSQQEQITNVCYNRAYKTMKAKVENAQELLSSCKKVLSHRMQEMELTHLQ